MKDTNPKNKHGFLLKISQDSIPYNDSRFGVSKYEAKFGEIKYEMSNEGNGICRIGANGPRAIYSEDQNLNFCDEESFMVLIEKHQCAKRLSNYLKKIETIKKQEFEKIKLELKVIRDLRKLN